MQRKLIFSTKEITEKGGLTFADTLAESELLEDSEEWGEGLGEVQLTAPCRVQLQFSVGGESLLLEGNVQGQWDVSCSRCLAPHKVDFDGALEETYPLSQQTIDVWEEVRQAMILSVPGKSLCSPTCLGLCPRCGKDLNQGPCGCSSSKAGVLEPK